MFNRANYIAVKNARIYLPYKQSNICNKDNSKIIFSDFKQHEKIKL